MTHSKALKVKESRGDRALGIINVIVLLVFACIMAIPLLAEIAMSFSSKAASDMNIVNLWPVGFTLASWQYVLTQAGIWRSFFISVSSTLIGTILALLITSMMAYPLSKKEFGPTKALMLFVVFTMIFKAPTVPYFLTLRRLGLYNSYWVLVIPHILTAYNLIIMRTFFMQFPHEIEEAAEIDGCGKFKLLFHIVLPSSKAVLATEALFYGVTMWNQYQHPLMFIQDVDLFPLQMKIRQIINSGGDLQALVIAKEVNYTQTTLSAATVVFAMVPVLIMYPFIQKYFAKGAMLGSVKG